MTCLTTNPTDCRKKPLKLEQANVRIVLLVLACFLLGVGVSAFWFAQGNHRGNATPEDVQGITLSDATKAALKRLDAPLEIRFYSLLDPATVPDSWKGFAQRVEQLLSAYQHEANGKVKVTRYDTSSYATANAATADGLKAFNVDKGDACFLGLALNLKQHKESLPQLAPEWESALESDLTRAVLRLVVSANQQAAVSVAASHVDATALEEVKRSIPDPASVSLEDGTRVLREAALKEFKAAAKELENQVKEAQARLNEAQNGKSAAEQEAAMKHLQAVQAEQTEKLRQIAANTQAQIEAFRQVKAATP